MSYAAIGHDDQDRPIVWGLGNTEKEALEQARDNLNSTECEGAVGHDLRVVKVTKVRAAQIEMGNLDASDL